MYPTDGLACSLPELGAHPPSNPEDDRLRREVRQLRHRVRELEAENKSYADTCRMFGINKPMARHVAYWQEAQRLLNNAIEQHYSGRVTVGAGKDDPQNAQDKLRDEMASHRLSQALSAEELSRVRVRHEQRVAAVEQLRAEVQGLRQQLGMPIDGPDGARHAWGSTHGRGKLSEPMVPLLVHEAKIKDLRKEHAEALQAERERLSVEVANEMTRKFESKLQATMASSQTEMNRTLDRERSLLSDASSRAKVLQKELEDANRLRAEEEAKAKAQRVELLQKRAARRLFNLSLSRGWSAWVELWEAKVYALRTLRHVANALQAPEVAHAFAFWSADRIEAKREAAYAAMAARSRATEAELARTQEEMAQATLSLTSGAAVQANALERQIAELKAAAAEKAAEDEARAKEARIEQLHRQATRRVFHSSMHKGWAAWVEMWEAKIDAKERLRVVANRLKAPELAKTFAFWSSDQLEAKRKEERRRVLRQNDSLEGQLRYAKYEVNQLTLIKVGQEDELAGLRAKVAELTADVKAQAAELAASRAKRTEVGEMQARYEEEKEEIDEAKERVAAAEAEVTRQIEAGKELLRSLLDEQRKRFELEISELKSALAEKTEAEQREARVEALHKAAMRRLLHKQISRGWDAWTELCDAKRYAKDVLRSIGSRTQVRGLGGAFTRWTRAWQAQKHFALTASKEEVLAVAEKERRGLESDLACLRKQLDAVVAQRAELIAKVASLSGDSEEVRAMLADQEAAERERRVETFGRQAVRRLMHAGVRRGFGAWLEAWKARKYAKHLLAVTGERLRITMAHGALEHWCAELEASKVGAELMQLRTSAANLKAEMAAAASQALQAQAALEAQLAAAQQETAMALERQRVELAGSQEEREALLAQKAKEERIELMRRQAGRRMLQADLAAGWEAWQALWAARSYAMRKLREVGNRLKKPELAYAFGVWGELLAAKREAENHTRLTGLQKREVELVAQVERLKDEVRRAREETDARLAQAEEEKNTALQRQLVELTGSAEEIVAAREAEEKSKRVKLFARQIGRRILNQSLTRGFGAWHDYWQTKRFALAKLQEVGNMLHAPLFTVSFAFWAEDTAAAKRQAAWRELQAQSQSLEAQLRQSRYESKQTALKMVAADDEIRALRAELSELTDGVRERDVKIASYGHLPEEVERLRERNVAAEAEAKEAMEKREEAERDVLRQLDASKELLEKLLAEQRSKFGGESTELKKQLSIESAARHKKGAELERVKEEAERKEKAATETIAKLRAEVKRLTAPPPKKEKPKPKGMIDLDESPDAPPIAEQLANALRENSTRVLDLFRSWDADGDGQVSRAEFHKAMAALGLEVEKKVIDDLFSEWDTDGGGELGYAELSKILKARPPPKPKK